jgi:hypothetical protein
LASGKTHCFALAPKLSPQQKNICTFASAPDPSRRVRIDRDADKGQFRVAFGYNIREIDTENLLLEGAIELILIRRLYSSLRHAAPG